MYRPATTRRINLLLSVLLAAPVAAQSTTDFEQPILVDARSQFVDGKNKTSIFQGDVRIVQGTLEITADEVEAIATDGQGQEIFIARGQPARYTQLLEDGTPVSASAKSIRYDVATQNIQLTGNAELRQESSMVTGSIISYDMQTQQLMATGDQSSDAGRVTTVFRPELIKKKTGAADSDTPDSPN